MSDSCDNDQRLRMMTLVVKIPAPYDVYIGRPSIWGNPFVIGRDGDRATVLQKYGAYLSRHPQLVERARRELRGKILGCYCAPLPCHGDLLKELVEVETG